MCVNDEGQIFNQSAHFDGQDTFGNQPFRIPTHDADAENTPGLRIGDYVCLANESCIPQIPAALHSALSLATATQVLAFGGDMKGAQALEARVGFTIGNLKSALTPRVKGKQQKWVNRNSPLRLRHGGGGGGGFGDSLP